MPPHKTVMLKHFEHKETMKSGFEIEDIPRDY